jgi:hypothetical protein
MPQEINPAQARFLALFDKKFAQGVVSWRIEGASHPSVLDGLIAYGKFAYLEKRATCNLTAQFRLQGDCMSPDRGPYRQRKRRHV